MQLDYVEEVLVQVGMKRLKLTITKIPEIPPFPMINRWKTLLSLLLFFCFGKYYYLKDKFCSPSPFSL